ncbi:Protein of unknown function [Micromonospora phaseoli]|uniref:DUF3558 domain-containing protein n=1 Tax=Micromonospora phaseoli TaxID=1144548 RepID=A0A1H7AL22_9ACTN|nr:hypothetical protein [Micromonospora phaseoli]PZV96492.1 hypothetical protein CLV64_107372 [Micromonospora phaseoli]GIJ76181.1 hypothetical protein Xph01_06130 [Micromonospora phaseoli]SEJ62570.1 Protein of unknown function [Micromonospora phaseoli]
MNTTSITRRYGVRLLVVALAFTAVGCGGPDGASAPAGESTAASSGSRSAGPVESAGDEDATGAAVCELLTVAEAGGLFGTTATIDSGEGSTRECVWVGRDGGMHQLHLQVYTGRSYYSPARWGGTGEPVTGLGDEAFLIRSSPLGVTAGTRDGEQVVFLNYQILLGANAKPAQRADNVTRLLRTAVDRL